MRSAITYTPRNGSSCLLVSLSEKTLTYLMYTITFLASQRVMRSHQVCDPHHSLAFLSFSDCLSFATGLRETHSLFSCNLLVPCKDALHHLRIQRCLAICEHLPCLAQGVQSSFSLTACLLIHPILLQQHQAVVVQGTRIFQAHTAFVKCVQGLLEI